MQIFDLTQVPCQFLESEGNVDHNYTSEKKADCEAINAKTAEQRLAQAEPINLKAGDYVFRVTNKNVPYDLGFWLRGDGLVNRATLPSVSGGGLSMGATRDYKISLEPGEYVYSCPLNTTPDYKLVVAEQCCDCGVSQYRQVLVIRIEPRCEMIPQVSKSPYCWA